MTMKRNDKYHLQCGKFGELVKQFGKEIIYQQSLKHFSQISPPSPITIATSIPVSIRGFIGRDKKWIYTCP
jgi:hypothetical protein